jgi:hypothetical protein
MIKRILFFGFLVLLLLAGCAGPAAKEQAADTRSSQHLTVYRSPT